jgi:hypothetical protein
MMDAYNDCINVLELGGSIQTLKHLQALGGTILNGTIIVKNFRAVVYKVVNVYLRDYKIVASILDIFVT